jgi:DNA repair protein RecO (recombination protein O)
MSGTYKAIGINLKSTPLGEADRLLTILTEELGLIRVVAPGARKHKSSLAGRSGLFVVNQLLIAKGRSLDKIVQAESLESYPGLSQDLSKLTAGQYLAELVLYQALSDQPQADLLHLFREHLSRLEYLPQSATLASLAHATFHLLVLAGLAPQVQTCCLTQQSITPELTDPTWQIGFSPVAGGIVSLAALEQLPAKPLPVKPRSATKAADASSSWSVANRSTVLSQHPADLCTRLNAEELEILQQLAKPDFIQDLIQAGEAASLPLSHHIWQPIEQVLRQYAEFHFERPIRSAALIDTCFTSASCPFPSESRS